MENVKQTNLRKTRWLIFIFRCEISLLPSTCPSLGLSPEESPLAISIPAISVFLHPFPPFSVFTQTYLIPILKSCWPFYVLVGFCEKSSFDQIIIFSQKLFPFHLSTPPLPPTDRCAIGFIYRFDPNVSACRAANLFDMYFFNNDLNWKFVE